MPLTNDYPDRSYGGNVISAPLRDKIRMVYATGRGILSEIDYGLTEHARTFVLPEHKQLVNDFRKALADLVETVTPGLTKFIDGE